MDMNELLGKHVRLRKELKDAYSLSPWDTAHIDRLVTELIEIESQLSRRPERGMFRTS